MTKKEQLQKIAMTLLSQKSEISQLKEELETTKKAQAVDGLVDELVERGLISDAVKDSKREELLSKTAEEINSFKSAIQDLTSKGSGVGEVSKEAATSGKDKFDSWLLS